MKKNPKCPKCKSANTALIIYGDTRDFDSTGLDRKISFGGCCIEHDSPKWKCLKCKNLWGKIFPKKFDPKKNYKKILNNKLSLQRKRAKILKKLDRELIDPRTRAKRRGFTHIYPKN